MLVAALFASSPEAFGQLPCDCAQRWTGGGHWNPDGTINELPNAPLARGIIRCASAAETQSQVVPKPGCVWNSTQMEAYGIQLPFGEVCFDPSEGTGGTPIQLQLPTEGQPIIWFNFDVRAYISSFSFQLNDNSGDNLGWALYASNDAEADVDYYPSANDSLSGNLNCTTSNLTLLDFGDGTMRRWCGSESSNTWSTPTSPESFDPLQPGNFYLLIWDQDGIDNNVEVNNFKARFGCGDPTICFLEADEPEIDCNTTNGTYTVTVPITGNNGQYVGTDPNATPTTSAPVCLTNLGETGVITGEIVMTYPIGVDYNISIAPVVPATDGCATPFNPTQCTAQVSGTAPFVELDVDFTNETCAGEDDGTITATASVGATITVDGMPYDASAEYAPGSYQVCATSPGDGCQACETVVIGEGTDISVDATATNESCEDACDGTIMITATPGATVTVNGGAPQATYCPGTYTIIASLPDGNGSGTCTATTTVEVGEGTDISVDATATNESCEDACDGTIMITATPGANVTVNGGAPQATYCPGTYTIVASLPDGNGSGTCTATTTVEVGEGTDISVDATATNESCEDACDGTIMITATPGATVTVNGGAPQATYCPGTYTIVASLPDGNGSGTCTATTTVEVGEGTVISVDATATNAACGDACDGTIMITATPGATVTVNGGAPQATYCPGTYTIVASLPDGNGSGTCTATTTVEVGEGTDISVDATATNESCEDACDGTIMITATPGATVTVNGGAPQATYCPGTYTIVASLPDGNGSGTCTATTTVEVGEGTEISVDATATNESCEDACDGTIMITATPGATVTVNGGAPQATYCPGTYTIVASLPDGNGSGTCTATTTVEVGEGTMISVDATATNAACGDACDGTISITATPGATVTVNGGAPQATYCPGTYTIVASLPDGNGSGTCTATTTVEVGEGTEISVDATATNESCEDECDGTIMITATPGATVTVNGGAPQATYCPGTYTIVASLPDGNGSGACTATTTVEVGEGTEISVDATATNESCEDECDGTIMITATPGATVTVNGGAPQATYCPGTYTIVASLPDGNGSGTCTATTTVEVGEGTVISVDATATNAACGDACDGTISITATPGATVTVNGGAPQATYCPGTYTIVASLPDGNGSGTCTATTTVEVGEGTDISVDATATNESCEDACDGTIMITATPGATVTVNGGAPQATYCPGTYTIVASLPDGNGSGTCTATTTVEVGEGTEISVDATATNESCEDACDGTIMITATPGATVTVNGGAPQATYCPGTYTIVASLPDGNNTGTCTATTTVEVGEGTVVELTVDHTDESCDGADDGTITASGGTSITVDGATYDASATYGPGSYLVCALAEGGNPGDICSDCETVIIGEGPAVELMVSGTDETCADGNDGTITASATLGAEITVDGAPYDAVASYAPGSYLVCATVPGTVCEDCETVTIGEAVALTLEIEVECNGATGTATAIVTGGTGDYDYLWSTGETTPSISGLPNGQHWVMVTDENGCFVKDVFDVDCFIPCQFRTQTQGGWGAKPKGGNPGSYLHANFSAAFPMGVEIGCNGRRLRLTSAQAVTTFLPSGGTPSILPLGLMINPTTYNNVLAGQLVALKLSVGFDVYDESFGESTGLLAGAYVAWGPFAGMTVAEVLEIADQVIGGCSNTYTYSQVNQVLSMINENFVDGTVDNGFLICTPPVVVRKNVEIGQAGTTFQAYPNPVRDILSISVAHEQDADVIIELLDLSGRSIKQVANYEVKAGEQRLWTVAVEELQSGVYILSMQENGHRTIKRISITR
jgi:hypothetical protein